MKCTKQLLRPILSCAFAVAVTVSLASCDVAIYPYYMSLKETKPVFIICIDTSGSNSSYIASVTELAEDSEEYLLANLYNGDEETMDEHFRIVDNYPDGESWAHALIAEPSELAGMDAVLDDYPNRIVLFYGNGAGASADDVEAYHEELEAFIEDTYSELNIYLGRLIHTTPSDASSYTAWADHLIDGTGNIEFGYPSGGPVMSNYGWGYTEYDPSTIENEEFLEDLIGSIIGLD